MLKNKTEVVKHSAAIHIQNNITLLQRRAWNVLLANAYDELPTHETHSVRVSEVADILEFDSKNYDYLKEALEALVGCKLKWNILGKDSHWEWGVTTLLAHAIIKNGLCTYSYSAPLRERLHNPNMYARISLSMQNKFDSKHAQALWELCVDYLNESKNYGETPFIPLDDFKDFMGLAGSKYANDFKILNRDVIKASIKEINRVTDFRVETDYQRKGRKVVAIKFKVRRELELPHNDTKQGTLFPDLEDMPVAVKALKDAGLSQHDAWEVWQQGFNIVNENKRPNYPQTEPEKAFTDYIREKIDLLHRQQQQKKVKYATGFLLKAIKENYANPNYDPVGEQKKNELGKKTQAALIKKKELEKKRKLLEAGYTDCKFALCEQIAHNDPELLERAMQEVRAEKSNAFAAKDFDNSKSVLENYLATQGLRSLVDERLMSKCTDRFEELYQSHINEIRDLDDEIEKMKAMI